MAYEVTSADGIVKLNMGGRIFEGKAKDGGRVYKTATNEYVVKAKASGFELLTKDKPTWTVSITDDEVAISSGDKKLTIAKEGSGHTIKRGDKLIGKIESDGKKVKVTDANDKVKWTGEDGPVAAWGVLILTDIGQPMRRLLFTELVARGR